MKMKDLFSKTAEKMFLKVAQVKLILVALKTKFWYCEDVNKIPV